MNSTSLKNEIFYGMSICQDSVGNSCFTYVLPPAQIMLQPVLNIESFLDFNLILNYRQQWDYWRGLLDLRMVNIKRRRW